MPSRSPPGRSHASIPPCAPSCEAALVLAAGSSSASPGTPRARGPRRSPESVHAAAESGTGCARARRRAGRRGRLASGSRRPRAVRRVQAGFADARGASEFAAGHVTNAVHLPPAGHADEAIAVAALRAYRSWIVYDGDYTCALADEVAQRLAREGWPTYRSSRAPGRPGSRGGARAPRASAPPATITPRPTREHRPRPPSRRPRRDVPLRRADEAPGHGGVRGEHRELPPSRRRSCPRSPRP